MANEPDSTLVRLKDTDLTTTDPRDDVRGRKVVDRDGEEVGKVEGLLIDEDEKRVRFLEVGSGGFLGIGEDKRLIPVDAVTGVDEDQVHIDARREHVAGSPGYDPDLEPDESYYGDLYGYYGYPPYWGPGYVYPPYPY